MFLVRITQALDKSGIDYAIVGGFAVSLHGAVRGTIDLDLVINLTEQNFIKAEQVFKAMGLEPRLPVSGSQVFKFRNEYIRERNLIAWSFYHPRKLLECVDIIITEDRKKLKVVKIDFEGHALKVASIDDLIRMKSKTGRPQDQSDVEALKRLKG